MRVLIVSFYFPPAGGGGVQRVLKLCRHLPELGVDVDVLAPDDPEVGRPRSRRLAATIPAGTTVHRARYRGPSHAQTPAARLAAAHGLRALGVRAALLGRRVLLPDPEVAWLPDARARRRRASCGSAAIDVVLSTSPPNSAHVIGAAIARRTGVPLRGRLPRLVARQPAPALRAAQRARQARGRGAHRARRAAPRRRRRAP